MAMLKGRTVLKILGSVAIGLAVLALAGWIAFVPSAKVAVTASGSSRSSTSRAPKVVRTPAERAASRSAPWRAPRLTRWGLGPYSDWSAVSRPMGRPADSSLPCTRI